MYIDEIVSLASLHWLSTVLLKVGQPTKTRSQYKISSKPFNTTTLHQIKMKLHKSDSKYMASTKVAKTKYLVKKN